MRVFWAHSISRENLVCSARWVLAMGSALILMCTSVLINIQDNITPCKKKKVEAGREMKAVRENKHTRYSTGKEKH